MATATSNKAVAPRPRLRCTTLADVNALAHQLRVRACRGLGLWNPHSWDCFCYKNGCSYSNLIYGGCN